MTAAERKIEELMALRREEQVPAADALISICHWILHFVNFEAFVHFVLHRRKQRVLLT